MRKPPFAIQHRTHVAVGTRADGVIRVASTFADAVEVPLADLDALFPDGRDTVAEWARYPLGGRVGGARTPVDVLLEALADCYRSEGLAWPLRVVLLLNEMGVGMRRRKTAEVTGMREAMVTAEFAPRPFMDDSDMPYALRRRRYERWLAKYEAWCRRRDEWLEAHGWREGAEVKAREESDHLADAPFDPAWEISNGRL